MADKRRQHTVPRSYLVRFSSKRKNGHYCFVIDKNSKNTFECNIDNVSVENNFYTLDEADDPLVWENYYASNIEPMMSNTIEDISRIAGCVLINNEAIVLNPINKRNLAISMVYQLLRGKQARQFINKRAIDELPKVIQDTNKKIETETGIKRAIISISPTEDFLKTIAASATLNYDHLKSFLPVLLNRYWIIYKIMGDMEFITSDNPVMVTNSITNEVLPFHSGLADSSTICYFPLTSKLMIACYSKIYYGGVFKDYDNKVIILNAQKEKKYIDSINSSQIKQCYHQAYAKNKESFYCY